jgi:hypothetical protein
MSRQSPEPLGDLRKLSCCCVAEEDFLANFSLIPQLSP